MFYYAKINNDYLVINLYELTESSTNVNYIAITEEQYTNGNLVGKYYNALSGNFEVIDMDNCMGSTIDVQVDATNMSLSTKLDNLQAEINNLTNNSDDGVSQEDLQVLEDTIATKADANHSHTEYALVDHAHDNYATQVALDALSVEVDEKADASHSHSEYASSTHLHNEYSNVNHNHDSNYAPLSHSHTEYVTTDDFNTLETEVDGKANVNHIHDNYATVSDLDELSSVVSGKANATDLNSHASDTELHISESEREYWNAKSDFSGSYNDLTNKPAIPSIDGLATEDYVDEKVGAITVESIGALPNTTVIPTVPTNVSAFTNDAGYLTEHQSLDGLATETYVNTQIDAIDIPNTLSDLTTDSTHRVVTDAEKATWNAKSDFSGSYNDLTDKPTIPSISGLATETYVDEAVSTKADSNHNHNDIYYTETEINDKLATKADSSHNHTGVYDENGAAASALASAQAYTDEAIDALSETVATKADASTLSSHTGNTAVHITSAERSKLSGIAEGANNYVLPSAGTSLGGVKSGGDVTISSGVITVNDDSHNHVISNVDGLQSALDSKAASGHNHDGVYYTETEIDTLLEGKANSSHTHTISNITNLQSTLDGKANASHGTHVSYSTTAPVMDGSASVGTASTVARSDHKHPTDTSRAAQTSLDSHTSNKSNPHGVTLAQLGLTATAAELNALDGITATVTELNFVDGVTSNIQTQLNSKAASSHTHTIANISNLQTTLDGKAALSHNHSASNITSGTLSSDRLPTVPISKGGTGATTAAAALTNLGITATASELNKLDGVTATTAELNYVDGVTSNIQTQLNAKASSSHTHNYAGSSSAGGAATSANKLNTNAGDANTPVYFSNGIPVACTSLDLNTTGSAAKLTTARNIALGNDLTGSANFDGSGNITISAKHYNTSVNSGNKSNYPYHRIAYKGSKASPITGQYNDTDAILSIKENYNGGGYGILKVSLRTNNSTTTSQASAVWLARNNFALDDVKVGLYNVSGATYADIYLKVGTYARTTVSQIEGSRSWTLVASNEVNDTTTSDKKTSTECYVSIENAATTLHGQAYTSIIASIDGGQVNYANSAGSATTASACTGNAGTATKLATARTISLTGDVTGSTSFDGSGNVSITATVADDSHNHTIANVDGLQSALNGKSDNSHKHYATSVTVTGEDLNNYTDAGLYTFAQAYTPINAPSGNVNGWLLVMPWNQGNSTIKQLWFRHGSAGSNDFETYVRTKIGSNAWGSWSKYYTTSNPPTYAEVGASPAFTNSTGGVEYSYGSGSGKNVLTEISNMPQGFHTIYAIAGTTGNPETTESYRYFIHKTSTTIGWIYAFGADGSIYSNYLAGANTYKGWKTIHDAKRKPLWSSARYMTAGHTVTPSKKLSQCEHGWMLLWSDYDPDTATVNNTDFCTTMIPNRNWAGGTWNGASYYCDIPRYSAGTATDSESRIIKLLTVYDDKLVGNDNNNAAPRNDVVLRAVYEF